MKGTKITWKCKKCEDVRESYSWKRWEMDICRCGESGIDLEEWYMRSMGCPEIIKREETQIEENGSGEEENTQREN